MILLMSLYQMKSLNQLIKINEFFLAFRAVVLDICLPFMPIMTFVIMPIMTFFLPITTIVTLRKRFKFLANNKTSLLPKIKMIMY